MWRSTVRRFWILCGLICALSLPLDAGAQTAGPPKNPPVRLYGQVTAIQSSKDGTPLGFTLLTPARTVDIHISAATMFMPKSAEAQVEGFATNDYAIVMAKHTARTWVANRITFDVQPMPPAVLVSLRGTVARVVPSGDKFLMQLDNGDSRWVLVNRQTQWRVDGQLQAAAPTLTKGNTVVVTMRHGGRNWVATEIDVRPTPFWLGY